MPSSDIKTCNTVCMESIPGGVPVQHDVLAKRACCHQRTYPRDLQAAPRKDESGGPRERGEGGVMACDSKVLSGWFYPFITPSDQRCFNSNHRRHSHGFLT